MSLYIFSSPPVWKMSVLFLLRQPIERCVCGSCEEKNIVCGGNRKTFLDSPLLKTSHCVRGRDTIVCTLLFCAILRYIIFRHLPNSKYWLRTKQKYQDLMHWQPMVGTNKYTSTNRKKKSDVIEQVFRIHSRGFLQLYLPRWDCTYYSIHIVYGK